MQSVNPRPDGARSRLSFGTTGGLPVLASPSDPAIRPLHHPPTTPAAASSSPLCISYSWGRVQETINKLQRPHHGASYVPILEDPADVVTNIIVLSRDAPEFYEKHKKRVTTLGDALEWYSEHRPEFITALDAASCQPLLWVITTSAWLCVTLSCTTGGSRLRLKHLSARSWLARQAPWPPWPTW